MRRRRADYPSLCTRVINMILKINLKKVIHWLLICVWMVVIFSFSAAPAKTSQKTSNVLTERIVTIVVRNYNSLTAEKKEALLSQLSYFVRKSAHFSEYLILGLLMYLAFRLHNISSKKQILLSLAVSLLYSISDELHQLFVPGRGSRFTDVLIDFSGICVGVFLTMLVVQKKSGYR